MSNGMKFIGNYVHWIKQEWVDYSMENVGINPSIYDGTKTWKMWMDDGWKKELINNDVFNRDNFPYEPGIPIKVEGYDNANLNDYDWNICRYRPGEFVPFHIDELDCEYLKFWMPLQDYNEGHIFLYQDTLIQNYKKGDVFLFDGYQPHAAGNLGNSTRSVFIFDLFGNLMEQFKKQYL